MNLINIVNLYGYDYLFSKMELDSRLNKEMVINSIMDYNGEFIPQYPEGPLFQQMIGTWSFRIKDGVKRMIDALEADYNPIENTDRYDEWTETTDSEQSHNVSRETGNTRNEDYTENTDDTTETSVSAYDSSSFTPKDKVTLDSGKTNTGTIQDSGNENEDMTGTGNETKTYSQHLHGNIGVTTNQQMIRDELDLRKFNIYTYIAEDFFDNLMIGVIG